MQLGSHFLDTLNFVFMNLACIREGGKLSMEFVRIFPNGFVNQIYAYILKGIKAALEIISLYLPSNVLSLRTQVQEFRNGLGMICAEGKLCDFQSLHF